MRGRVLPRAGLARCAGRPRAAAGGCGGQHNGRWRVHAGAPGLRLQLCDGARRRGGRPPRGAGQPGRRGTAAGNPAGRRSRAIQPVAERSEARLSHVSGGELCRRRAGGDCCRLPGAPCPRRHRELRCRGGCAGDAEGPRGRGAAARSRCAGDRRRLRRPLLGGAGCHRHPARGRSRGRPRRHPRPVARAPRCHRGGTALAGRRCLGLARGPAPDPHRALGHYRPRRHSGCDAPRFLRHARRGARRRPTRGRHRHGEGRPAGRPRWRLLPGRDQVGGGAARPWLAQVPHRQRRGGRARHLQGPPSDGKRPAPAPRGRAPGRLCGGGQPHLPLCPRRSRPVGAEAGGRCRRGPAMGAHRGSRPRQRFLGGGRAAARRRRLRARRGDGAHRIHRGAPGHAPRQAALPRGLGALGATHGDQQRGDALGRAADRPPGSSVVDGARPGPRHQVLRPVGPCAAPGDRRDGDGRDAARGPRARGRGAARRSPPSGLARRRSLGEPDPSAAPGRAHAARRPRQPGIGRHRGARRLGVHR